MFFGSNSIKRFVSFRHNGVIYSQLALTTMAREMNNVIYICASLAGVIHISFTNFIILNDMDSNKDGKSQMKSSSKLVNYPN